jgi:outer membrane lipoprotein carrier protein
MKRDIQLPLRSCILALLLLPLPALAGTGLDRLNRYFNDVQTITADFSQTVRGINQETLQESSGRMVIKRPDHFRWDYNKPYEQLIIGDGKNVWLYDVDLEQVTVKPADKALENTPAVLLSGKRPLQETFSIREQGQRDGLEWVELTPKSQEATFTRMLLAFNASDLQIMELEDSLGQLTILRFTNVHKNPVVKAAQFRFSPPDGVDVIGKPVE